MILRLSQKLKTKIKAGALPVIPLEDNPFADWSAHVFVADRTQYIFLCNTTTLYSTVLPGKGITRASHFIEGVLHAIRQVLHDAGMEFVYDRFIAPESDTVRFAKALNRTVTGSMNEQINNAVCCLTARELSLQDVRLRLNDILLSAVATPTRSYGTPQDAFMNLVQSMPP